MTPRYYKNAVILSDFGCDVAGSQIEMRLQNVFRYTATSLAEKTGIYPHTSFCSWVAEQPPHRPPIVQSIHTIPFGHVDFAAHALHSLYRALGSSTRPNIFIHVTDPGVGHTYHDRSMLVTDQGNVLIGPNNGALALIHAYFTARNIPFTLYTIDSSKVESLERIRMARPAYKTPHTFHGRDLFAVVAGLIAAGVDPKELAMATQLANVKTSPFATGIRALPEKIGHSITCHAFKDRTFGNLKTNVYMSAETMKQLAAEQAVYQITSTKKGRFGRMLAQKLKFQVVDSFQHAAAGTPILYLGSSYSVAWDSRFVELAMVMKNAGDALDIPESQAAALSFVRIS